MYDLSFKASSADRANPNFTRAVEAIIEGHGAEIVGAHRRSLSEPEGDDIYRIKASHANALSIQRHLAQVLSRLVHNEYVKEA